MRQHDVPNYSSHLLAGQVLSVTASAAGNISAYLLSEQTGQRLLADIHFSPGGNGGRPHDRLEQIERCLVNPLRNDCRQRDAKRISSRRPRAQPQPTRDRPASNRVNYHSPNPIRSHANHSQTILCLSNVERQSRIIQSEGRCCAGRGNAGRKLISLRR